MKKEMGGRLARTRAALDALDDEQRLVMEGHRPGVYLRLSFTGCLPIHAILPFSEGRIHGCVVCQSQGRFHECVICQTPPEDPSEPDTHHFSTLEPEKNAESVEGHLGTMCTPPLQPQSASCSSGICQN